MQRARLASCAPWINNEDIQGNRVPQYYPLVALEMMGINSEFKWNCDFDTSKI